MNNLFSDRDSNPCPSNGGCYHWY